MRENGRQSSPWPVSPCVPTSAVQFVPQGSIIGLFLHVHTCIVEGSPCPYLETLSPRNTTSRTRGKRAPLPCHVESLTWGTRG